MPETWAEDPLGAASHLPSDEDPNPCLDEHVRCRYFFVRKVILFKYSYAFVALPGGFGTMDEIFEALTLIQTDKIFNFPVVLMGKDYWRPLRELLERMVDAGDLNLWLMTDDLGDALAHIREHAIAKFGLRARRFPRLSKWLREPARL